MSKDRLLSDEELLDKVNYILTTLYSDDPAIQLNQLNFRIIDLINQQVIQALEKIKQALPDTNDDNQFSPDGAGGWDLESYKLGIDDAIYEIDSLIKEYKGE